MLDQLELPGILSIVSWHFRSGRHRTVNATALLVAGLLVMVVIEAAERLVRLVNVLDGCRCIGCYGRVIEELASNRN